MISYGIPTRDNVLAYFCDSPFFDSNSNNQMIISQGLGVEHLARFSEGIEFVVDEINIYEPYLFVIKKQQKVIGAQLPKLLNVYYCLEGTIYHVPDVHTLLKLRLEKASVHLKRAFKKLLEENLPQKLETEEDECFSGELEEKPIKKFKKELPLSSFKNVESDLDFL